MLQGAMSSPRKPKPTGRELVIAFVASALIAAAVQWYAGAFATDLSAHPDEPAHAVTGLMIRDYIAGGILESPNPLTFARGYYERFPKVALGHYPPAFYLVEALWLVPARSVLGCMTLITALAAAWLTLTYIGIRRSLPSLHPLVAFLPAATVPLVAMVGDSLIMVMSDLMLALFCLAASVAFAAFIEKPTYKRALLFGLLAAVAGLTKASGLLLAIVPPAACVLSGKWRLLLDRRTWVAPVPVVLTVIPWILATRHITQEGMLETPVTEFVPAAVRFYANTLADQFGIATLLLVLVYAVTLTRRVRSKRTPPDPTTASLASLAIATIAFYSLVPAGLEPRYLLPATPGLLLFAAGAIIAVSKCIPSRPLRLATAPVLGGIAVAGFVALPEPVGSGFDKVSASLLSSADRPQTVLVSSDAVGEGAVIATTAFSLPRDTAEGWKLLRSTKVLSTSDWMGRAYQPTVSTVDELASLLDSEAVTVVVDDSSLPERLQRAHNGLLRQYLKDEVPDRNKSLVPVKRTAHSDRTGEGDVTVARLKPPSPTTE